jgi:tRNA(adenine34) deaminase
MILKKGAQGMEHEEFMQQALCLAEEAAAEGEVPVGCVIIRNGQIVGRGRNRRETAKTALGHAEIEAIGDACKNLGGWRLWDCTMYVTLEPCPMCAGAIINARIPKVVCGAKDAKAGACGSVCDLFTMGFNHHPVITYGTLGQQCADLLTQFFADLRITLRSRSKWKRPDIE